LTGYTLQIAQSAELTQSDLDTGIFIQKYLIFSIYTILMEFFKNIFNVTEE